MPQKHLRPPVTAQITIEQTLCDKHLLGSALGHPRSWARWRAVLKAGFALPMGPTDQALFAEVSGDRPPPSRRVDEIWVIVGRRSGKTRIAVATVVYIAAIERHHLAPGEVGHVLLLAASRDQAKVAFEYVIGFLEASPFLRQEIDNITQNEVRLKNRVVIGVHAGSFRTVRGRTLLAVVGDETSFWRDESSASPDVEIYRACAPALAASRGMWIGISTGYKKAGLLYTKWKQHFGQPSDDVLVIQGPTTAFNATLDPAVIERARATDPEAYESEWLGGFRSDLAAFLDDATIDRAIEHGRPLELPPRVGVTYRAFVDASGGRGDAYCVAIAHAEPDRHVVDVVRGAAPPFDPLQVTPNYVGFFVLIEKHRKRNTMSLYADLCKVRPYRRRSQLDFPAMLKCISRNSI